MIDNRENQFPGEETRENPEMTENRETPQELPEPAAAETEAPAEEKIETEDSFTEAAEPAAEQEPPVTPVEPEIPSVEEPAEPVYAEADPPVPPQETPQGMPQQEAPQSWGVPQAPYGAQGGYPAGYSNGYVQSPNGYGGYPQQPFTGQPSAPYGYPQPPQPPYQPQSQPYYQPQPQPGYYGYYGQQQGYPVYGVPANPPKKKMSTGLKVFIWIASILAAAAILGFGSYLAYNAFAYSPSAGRDVIDDRIPFDRLPWGDRDEDEIPDFDDGVIPPEIDETDPVPDVDVTPNTDGITIHPQPKGEELSAQEVYQKVVKSTVTVAVTYSQNGRESHSTGTGIIATSDGYIITNSHVVMNSKSSVVEITAYDGQQYEAVVVGVDRTTDLAILKTNDYNFTPAEFGDSEELEIGDLVVAIGNPGGAKFSGSMTGGYISGLDRAVGSYSENGMTYIQTDAAINPGNSGGPLVNMYGQVVGINSSKIVSDGYEGMGFAIPVSKAQSIINELLSGGYVKGRTRLGITGADVTSSMAMFYNMPQGFVIYEISEESAFTGTEAEPGDVIIAIDGETVTGLTDISNLLLKYSPGDKATVTLYRQDGNELDVIITLLEDKGETQK